MIIAKQTTTAALAISALLALPAAAHAKADADSVRAHADRAGAALDRAVALIESNADKRAVRHLNRSRSELAAARRDAAKLRRGADTDAERAVVAQAEALIAQRQSDNLDDLVGALDDADGRLERKLAAFALQDARGRDRAIAVITARIEAGVPERALRGLTRALAALSTDRDEEVEDQAEALTEEEVSDRSKKLLAHTLEQTVEGQQVAAQRLAELLTSEDMPAQAKRGLQNAYDRVTQEHARVEQTIKRSAADMPDSVRAHLEQVALHSAGKAKLMRENRPGGAAGGDTATQGTGTQAAPEATIADDTNPTSA